MATEEQGTSNGWPLGLEIMNVRLRVVESMQAAAAPAQLPHSLRIRSPSFSSFTSSNLDTESTASFFQDHSVPLGRLIGIRPGEGGGLPFPRRSNLGNQREKMNGGRGVSSQVSKGNNGVDISRGICIPLLLGTLEKMNRSKNKSKQ